MEEKFHVPLPRTLLSVIVKAGVPLGGLGFRGLGFRGLGFRV